jgi:phosphomevalonate kinase
MSPVVVEVASCPAKIMLAGEYAVVDGGPAVLIAVNRRAVATLCDDKQELSPILQAVADVMAEEFAEESEAAQRALRIQVDTSSFYEGEQKLGLGSSAATSVAATAAALSQHPGVDTPLIHRLAAQAHQRAQQGGSGADIATCAWGGCIRFQAGSAPLVTPLTLPTGLELVFPWTGKSASTPQLLASVRAYRASQPQEYESSCRAISECAEQLTKATDVMEALQALDAAGQKVRELGQAANVPLWLPEHSDLEGLARSARGILKPTGAGGGDLALAAFANPEDAQIFRDMLRTKGILCPPLVLENQGVRLQR